MESNMDAFLKQFQHLKIQLKEITSATNNFHDQNCIGEGGFGKVYEGKLSHSTGRGMVAIKRLDHRQDQDQGNPEFLKEIAALSRFKHENLISLLGFCYQEKQAILVYQLASRGSLEEHLGSHDLTWTLRLKICLGAAKGLRHLHDPRGTHQRLIHCDVKSGNILLDDNWNAMVADFGFSTMGPANELQSTVINLAAGTFGYCDPYYVMTNTLTKESDVYSFGVVLVEVLCGSLCYSINNGSVEYNLVPAWIKSYEEKKLNDIIFKSPTIEPLEQSVLEIFSDIAYRCLKESREDRPEMAEVVAELEYALESQESKGEWKPDRSYYETISKTAEPPLNYRSEVELMKLFSKGVLLNGGKTWFSLNKKGEHCEMISIAECLGSEFESSLWSDEISRFPKGNYGSSSDARFKTHVKTQFLSPRIIYTVNLVFDLVGIGEKPGIIESLNAYPIQLKYKLPGETESSIAYLAYKREDEWWMCELYQFTSDRKIVNLQILFDKHDHHIEVEGIEFLPLEKVDEKQLISYSDSDSDANWKENLPTDYEDIMKRSRNSLQWTTMEEAYSIMSKGFLIGNDKIETERGMWFSLDKNGKNCLMISVVDMCDCFGEKPPLPESRFGVAYEQGHASFELEKEVPSQLLSSQTTYAVYLVYKLPKDLSKNKAPVRFKDKKYLGSHSLKYIHLAFPQTPVLKPKAGQNTHNPPSKVIKEGFPQQRKDGWMEVQLLDFRPVTTINMIPFHLEFESNDYQEEISGLIIEGVEFRPI